MNKKVFVIIVTYNGAHWIDKNITSLLNSSYPVSIIVVDNNSSDNSVALLEKYVEVDLIKSQDNLGFGKANNIGIKKALEKGADYIFLLNQDAWIFNDTISSLVSKMESAPELGIISPMHYSADETNLDSGFSTYLGRKSGMQNNIILALFVNAAAWMLSRECLQTVGLFEPAFSHYGEDRNYCDRVHYHGFKIGIDSDSKIVHDRVIKRSFNKDIVQSQYKILCTLLNINNSLGKSYYLAAKEVVGLPKYFIKHYGGGESSKLFKNLLSYYLKQLVSPGRIISIRNSHK